MKLVVYLVSENVESCVSRSYIDALTGSQVVWDPGQQRMNAKKVESDLVFGCFSFYVPLVVDITTWYVFF